MPNSNEEVIFGACEDGGKTFGEKINLSNTTDVVVTWWERTNQTDVPVMRVSNDNGKTFGPLLELGANGTIGSGEAKPIL
jgi:hypothetical protein